MNTRNNNFYRMIFVGMMAALIFVATYFLKVGPIPTPTGPTMIKTGNILCLLAGMLFGGLNGGLAAGIGSMLYDLMDPNYAPEAGFTLIFFFLMAFVCGKISHLGGAKGNSMKLNAIGAVSGASLYWVLNISKNIGKLMLAGSAFAPAVIANGTKMLTSLTNAVIATTFALLLVMPIKKALKASGVLSKIGL